VEETTKTDSIMETPDHLIDPDVWMAFAERFTRLWKQQTEASESADARQRGNVA
jgi:hypothetical protein